MININVHRRKIGVPVLSRDEIDSLGEHLVADFCSGAVKNHRILNYDPDQLSMFDEAEAVMIQCRTDMSKTPKKNYALWGDVDWMEWQANALSSAILMPRCMVLRVANAMRSRFLKSSGEELYVFCCTQKISDIFNVSFEAATYRLEGLGAIRRELQLARNGMNILDIVNDKGI